MRTTLDLADGLVEAAKRRAAAEHRTLTSLIEEGLRSVLARDQDPPRSKPLPTYGTTADRALINIEDRDALYAAFEEQ
ncbi:MAG: CopG family transcriptional regulator [Actinobacteria bacterium]|nr:CopG family transcriptional regulator [Actinomycetota bacterium]